jgi:hypothetical protein
MKCSKRRVACRPFVENLESRLQPGSIITGQGYGWSLLADHISILDQGSFDSQSLVSQRASESSQPTTENASLDVHSDHIAIAVASVATARGETLSTPASSLVNNLVSDLTNGDLADATLTGRPHSVPLADVAAPTVQSLAPATPLGSVPQSPTGVAAPAVPAQTAVNTSQVPQLRTAPVPAPAKLTGQVIPSAPAWQSNPNFHVNTQSIASAQINSGSNPVWATYLGSSGDDRLLNITLDPNANATQPIVVVGFTQNPNDATDFEGLVARVSNDGSSATVFKMDLGSNTRLEFHSAAVDPNDGAIYVTGQETQGAVPTDVVARINPTLTSVDWAGSPHQQAPTMSASGNSVHLDSTGMNLYVAGVIDGNLSVSQLTNLTSTAPTVVFDEALQLQDANGNTVGSAGNGIAPDSAGNLDLAIQVQTTPNTEPGVLQLDPTGANINWAGSFKSTGADGTMNAVYVDSSDNVFVTGGLGDMNAPLLDQITASFDSMGNQLGGIVLFFDPTQGGGQNVGYAIQTDALGNVFTGITDSGTDLAGNMAFIVYDSGLTNFIQTEGDASGSKDDQNRGFVLDPTNSAAYQAGFTSSPDFSNIQPNAFQSTYGGDPYDGVVIGYHVE